MQKRKSKEERATESYYRATDKPKAIIEKEIARQKTREDLLKGTTEKEQEREKEIETVIKNNSKEKIPKKVRQTPKRTTTKETSYSVPKILLKENGYELIITEKPQAATKIASSLGIATKREFFRGVPYYEVDRNGKKIIVACAVGHLFTLKQTVPGTKIPTFEIDWFPNYLVRKNDYTKKYYDTLLKLAKNAGSLTVATDFDIEGEVIGANVVKLICNQKDARRMKFSTLTEKELNEAYENKLENIKWGQEIAGEARHYLDWYYGINLSRALMDAIKTTGKFKIMSIGRVQGPTLSLIVKKEREIKAFKPKPYWQVFAELESPELELKHTKDIFHEEELGKFKDLKGKEGLAKTTLKQQIVSSNPPFNLTTLQTEAYNLYGITPANTLKAAQSLYLAGLISYPRTSSQKLPDSIDYKKILNILKIRYLVSKLITKDKPIEGKKTDPAHPSIYPTGTEPPILSGDEEKIYNLIVKRFLALFCDSAIIDKKNVEVQINEIKFSKKGQEIKKKAWMEFYPVKTKEEFIPTVEGKVIIKKIRTEKKETQPPRRYSPASILSELEKKNLGTKATRAAILDTLYDRGYIQEKSIEATPLGIALINTLEKYSPIIIDEKLTKELQDEMDKMAESKKKPIEQKEKIIEKTKETIIKISKDFEQYKSRIGNDLINAELKLREKEKEKNKLCPCPKCKKGTLAITYSPKTRKFFVACDAYPECKNTYSLPPYGKITQTGKTCEHCGFPLLMSLQKGKKPWIFCFNDECKSNIERIKAYREKQAKK